MVDTIILTLDRDKFRINKPDNFEPSAKIILNRKRSLGNGGYISAKQNPTQKDFYEGKYKPRLTLTKRKHHTGGIVTTLRIELSLPKLMYGNNFDELTTEDFEALLKKLKNILRDMGVSVSILYLKTSWVSSIHYSKNIALTDGTIPYHFINKIKDADITRALDVNQTDYRGGGHCLKWHCNSYEIVFYDKIQDLKAAQRSDKRAIESDNAIQLNIFDMLQQRDKLEVLRIEIRLNKRQKIKDLFRCLKIRSELTFNELFKSDIAQAVLKYYVNEIERKIPPEFNYKSEGDAKALLTDLIFNNPNLTTNKMFQKFGLIFALKVVGQPELEILIGKNERRALTKLIDELRQINLAKKSNSFEIIHRQLDEFKPLRLANFINIGIDSRIS